MKICKKIVKWKKYEYTQADIVLLIFFFGLTSIISNNKFLNWGLGILTYFIIWFFVHYLEDRNVYYRSKEQKNEM